MGKPARLLECPCFAAKPITVPTAHQPTNFSHKPDVFKDTLLILLLEPLSTKSESRSRRLVCKLPFLHTSVFALETGRHLATELHLPHILLQVAGFCSTCLTHLFFWCKETRIMCSQFLPCTWLEVVCSVSHSVKANCGERHFTKSVSGLFKSKSRRWIEASKSVTKV